jgi:hypothetical protein
MNPWNGAAAAYAAFLHAIAARSFDDIHARASIRLQVALHKMRECTDFSVLFQLWCESYPRVDTLLSVEHDDTAAVVAVQGHVAGERVHVCASIVRFRGTWYVDTEYFSRLVISSDLPAHARSQVVR